MSLVPISTADWWDIDLTEDDLAAYGITAPDHHQHHLDSSSNSESWPASSKRDSWNSHAAYVYTAEGSIQYNEGTDDTTPPTWCSSPAPIQQGTALGQQEFYLEAGSAGGPVRASSTAARVYRKFEAVGRTGRPSECSAEVVSAIEAYIADRPDFTQSEVTAYVRTSLGIEVTRPTVCRWLQRIRKVSSIASRQPTVFFSPSKPAHASRQRPRKTSLARVLSTAGSYTSHATASDSDDASRSPPYRLFSPQQHQPTMERPANKLLTLAFLVQDDRILLGLKKRGFGAGNWNGFGE